ncbi:LuxR family transcriptional regulator [Desulfuromonas soudanensis]|uniref:LuxR family transcriptional regulator n=1 Tax=Desulfuromonas soudanensis TaxID=1603606 RepID=A0A0M3QGG2_9BACT|nr:response regulator transcription factor [Desulfuromonas soudanensis]ALC17763.1 LuxR family transcriptional regulator [Desulfuromonas soudanensis]
MVQSSPGVDAAPTSGPLEPIRILVCLYNRCLSQALCTFLRLEEPGFDVRHSEEAEPGFTPTHFLTDLPSLEQCGTDAPPEAKVIVFDEGLDQLQIEKVLSYPNFAGLIRSTCNNRQLVKAIRCVQKGEVWIDGATVKSLLQRRNNRRPEGETIRLTLREQQIAEMILQGMKNKEIASRIFLSESTVKVYISRIYKKHQVPTRAHLIHILTQPQHKT